MFKGRDKRLPDHVYDYVHECYKENSTSDHWRVLETHPQISDAVELCRP